MSKAIIITVSLKDSRSNPPKIKLTDSANNPNGKDDNITTNVDLNDIITWVPNKESGISALMGVFKNTKVIKDNYNLLDGNPIPDAEGNYVGSIVSKSPGKGKKEQYNISFTIDGDSTTYTDDPKLKIQQ